MNDTLSQRLRWFRSFPEGPLEFLLVTRISGVFLLLSLAVARAAQRPMVLMALALMLLLDYVLMIWWAVQMAIDLKLLTEDSQRGFPVLSPEPIGAGPVATDSATRREPRPHGQTTAVLACLPAAVVFVALTPWPELAFSNPSARAAFLRVFLPVCGLLFLACLLIGRTALLRVRLGPPLWTTLLLVPFLHWFAMHRVLAHFRARLRGPRRDQGEPPADATPIAVPLADVTWILAVLPWAAVAALRLITGAWSPYFPPCGSFLVAVFAVADLAAMEGFQRQFTAALRRAGLPPRP